MSTSKITLPLPAPHARVNGKLGTFCSFESTQARRGDAVYTEEQVSALVAQAEAMLDDLAKRMQIKPQEVTRILDLRHATKIDTLAAAIKATGAELKLAVV